MTAGSGSEISGRNRCPVSGEERRSSGQDSSSLVKSTFVPAQPAGSRRDESLTPISHTKVPCRNFCVRSSTVAQLHRFLVTVHPALQFNLRIRNESGPLPPGYSQDTWGHHAVAWNWRCCADLISFIISFIRGAGRAKHHAARILRDGSGLRGEVFGFGCGNVGAQPWRNGCADRGRTRMPERSGGSDRADGSLVYPVNARAAGSRSCYGSRQRCGERSAPSFASAHLLRIFIRSTRRGVNGVPSFRA